MSTGKGEDFTLIDNKVALPRFFSSALPFPILPLASSSEILWKMSIRDRVYKVYHVCITKGRDFLTRRTQE